MARKIRRANCRKSSVWRTGNTLERRSTIGLGFLNTNGWNEPTQDDVEKAMQSNRIDVYSLVETDAKKKPSDAKPKIIVEGCRVFEVHRTNKDDRTGGGIACVVKKSAGVVVNRYYPKISDPAFNYVSTERLWIKYKSEHGKSAICTTYLGFQATDDRHKEWNVGIYKVLSEEIKTLRTQGFRIFLQGDFNAWIGAVLEQGGIPGNKQKVTKNGELFLEFLRENNLVNVNAAVRVPGDWDTRICKGLWTRHASDYVSSSIIDYVLVSAEHIGSVVSMTVDEDGVQGGASDHNMLFSRWCDKFISVPDLSPVKKRGWDTEKADWVKFREVVHDAASHHIDAGNNGLDNLNNALTGVLTKGLNVAVGRKSSTPQKRQLFPRHIVQLIKERKKLEKFFKTAKSKFFHSLSQLPPQSVVVAKENLEEKTDELNLAKEKFKRQKRAPLVRLAKDKSPRSRRKFWDFVNRKASKTSDIPPLQNQESGVLKTSPQEISDEIFSYLKNIFSGSDEPVVHHNLDVSNGDGEDRPPASSLAAESNRIDEEAHQVNRDHEYDARHNQQLPKSGSSGHVGDDPAGFLDRDFTVQEVSQIVKSLGNGKAAGSDEVINEALKEAPVSFLQLLTKLFNMVKSKGQVPRSWNRGRLVLVHKKHSISDVNNYRPLTVLNSFCATYSKVLNARLTEVAEVHNLLGEVQNGFRKNRSGIDSVFTLNTILWKTIAKRRKVNLAFLDLTKAYDSVNRDTLWKKLSRMGFGGKFLASLQSLYKSDYVTCESNGVTTKPVYLGRGLRQGCSLSPMLFALYVSDMSRDLHEANLGVLLHKVCVSAMFFADDIVLIARDGDGLRLLLEIVQRHCSDLDMELSVSKSKVMSTIQDVWVLFGGDQVVGALEKVIQFKYLGVQTKLSPSKAATVMMERATSLADSYRKSCISIARDGPDIVDLALSLWSNIAMPSILYGCEVIPFSKSAIQDIERHQSAVGKYNLGLPVNAPNISTTTILGVKPFKELLYSAQLRYLVKLFKQDDKRWSKDAFIDHLEGGWQSPYVKYMGDIMFEVGLHRWPKSAREVNLVLEGYFTSQNDAEISRLSLPALEPPAKRARMLFVDESKESKVYI